VATADIQVLATNDDGIRAPGLAVLVRAMKRVGRVFVIAPEHERSAVGHAITMTDPLRVWREDVPELDGVEAYAVDGTPADTVKVAVKAFNECCPDIVVSGINLGGNYGTNVIYSGTVSAATEGTILGIPSVAISLDTFSNPYWDAAAEFAVVLVQKVLKEGLPSGVLLNVNVPNSKPGELKGVRVARQSRAVLDDYYEERTDPRGNRYLWLGVERMINIEERPDDDLKLIKDGYITITPIHYDLTNEPFMSVADGWREELEKNFPTG
jgi:5'-nucleotidase